MNTIRTSKAELILIKLDDAADKCNLRQLKSLWLHSYMYGVCIDTIRVPNGFTHLIPDIFNPSEEDAKMVIGEPPYVNFNSPNLLKENLWLPTATASFATLIEKEGYSRVNPYGSERPDTKSWKWQGKGYVWDEAQQKSGRFCGIVKIIK